MTFVTTTIVPLLEAFKIKGVGYLETLSKDQLNHMIHVANMQYHASLQSSTLTDAEFDILKDFVDCNYPYVSSLQEIGAEVLHSKQKVSLPVSMPSMDKIKPDTDALSTWMESYHGPYVLSCKLDGVSGLYSTMQSSSESEAPKLYTRGDGSIGQDVSKLLKYILLPTIPNVMIRGEFILPKTLFETKYKDMGVSNIRNMVAGIINQKRLPPEKTADIEFVAYEVIYPIMSPTKQMEFLQTNHFQTVKHETHVTLTNERLSDILRDWRNVYEYEIDGVIVANDAIYERTSKNPKHAFAFKMIISDQIAETQVTDVIWTPSKDGYLKPRVRVNPIYINGVKIEYATGFNGQFIEQHKIGIGAVIQIIRSGDVIPYIQSVTVPAETPKMPDVPYIWTDTHIDILLANKEEDPVVLEKQLTAFFTGIEVEGLSSGNVKRLIKAGYNSIPKILKMQMKDYVSVEGFKDKMAEKVYNSLHTQIEKSSVVKLLASANAFGRGMGERKLKPIFETIPTILVSDKTDMEKILLLQNIHGIGKENAHMFVEHIPHALGFLSQCNLLQKLTIHGTQQPNQQPNQQQQQQQQTHHPLYRKKIIFTGFRDKPLMSLLESQYETTFASSISKYIFVVVVKSLEESNAKIKQAKALEIPIMTYEEFKKVYLVTENTEIK